MSTIVSVKNRTKTTFQATTILFSEIDAPLDEFWHSKVTESEITSEHKVVFGKLIHPSELKSGANFIASILLTIVDQQSPSTSKKSFITLKTRLKGTKTGAKVYSSVSSYPESSCITKPIWRKGNEKVNKQLIFHL